MLNNNINKELERAAVYERDFEKVKVLLSTGANVNLIVERDKSTLLHNTNSVEITKELLLRGAEVNARNKYSETPLHSAITQGRELALVRELLKNGADVNAINRKGNTPFNHAVKRNSSEAIIKELLEYGADINIKNYERRLYDNHCTPLDNAVGNLACAKLLIKFTLIKNFNRDYRKIINFTPYQEFSNYSKLSRYLDDCICEITEMKKDKTSNNISLYGFYVEKDLNKIASYAKSREITDQVILTNYTIYHDIISAKIKLGLERANLLNKLSKLQIYNEDTKGKKVILDSDSAYNIAQYLFYDDLLNLILASSNNLVELRKQPNTGLYEASVSSCTKRARLE